MKITAALSNLVRVVAAFGGTITLLSGPLYLWETVLYGFTNGWHFQYVSGWGFRFLADLLLAVVGLLLTLPFLLMARTEILVERLRGRRLIIRFIWLGLLLLLLSAVIEELLKRASP